LLIICKLYQHLIPQQTWLDSQSLTEVELLGKTDYFGRIYTLRCRFIPKGELVKGSKAPAVHLPLTGTDDGISFGEEGKRLVIVRFITSVRSSSGLLKVLLLTLFSASLACAKLNIAFRALHNQSAAHLYSKFSGCNTKDLFSLALISCPPGIRGSMLK
jgi:hypothetical protein